MTENRPPHGKGQPVLDELQLVLEFIMELLADIVGMAGTSLVVGAFFFIAAKQSEPQRFVVQRDEPDRCAFSAV